MCLGGGKARARGLRLGPAPSQKKKFAIKFRLMHVHISRCMYTQIQARAPGLLTKLEAILQDREYLVKNTFSVADVAVCLSLSLSSFVLPFFL